MKKYGAFILIVCITLSLFFPVYSVNESIQDEPTFDYRPQQLAPERSSSSNRYTAIVDSTTDRWTVGDIIQYSTTAAPSGATITWSVSDPDCASVNSSTGLVTALSQGRVI